MRKASQQQIFDLLNTLEEAHAEIKKRIKRGETGAALQVLTDCREFVEGIKAYVDSAAGNGTETAELLEHFREYIRAAIETIGKSAAAQAATGRPTATGSAPAPAADFGAVKDFRRKVAELISSVQRELKPDRIEVVFFPYKASMWDALESIWLAAQNDPQCDAYVVPIPYYDRLPDGAFGREHYEGGAYPDYVPVVDWKTYDVEERRPDIIFIHNPYDNQNFVTTIHPDYYSSRLKEHTDLLVYSPYFVVEDDVAEHFCALPGTLYADKVIVQSEKVRQTYIRVFKAFEKKNNCRGRFGRAEDKFMALGSPKFDKAINARRTDFALPDAWAKLIWKPDGAEGPAAHGGAGAENANGTDAGTACANGTKKKVIFYNTSISALLQGGEQYLAKIRYVLDIFREREDAVLWWRPHPLSEATYQSMQPELMKEYKRITEEYKRDGYGIYDDTPDPHMAITLSDAYYGDWSSVVAMYAATGKPVMIQNVNYPESAGLASLQFENLYDDGQCFWFTAFSFNALFRMDRQTWKAEYMGSFPGETFLGYRQYRTIVEHGGKLYFTPGSARGIGVYDLADGSFETIRFDENEDGGVGASYKFKAAFVYQSKIFFTGFAYPAIICYDTADGKIERFDDWLELLAPFKPLPENLYFYRGAALGNKLFLPLSCADAVLEFDMDCGTSKTHKLNSGNQGFSDICFSGAYAFLTPRFGSAFVRWDTSSGEILKYEGPDVRRALPDTGFPAKVASYGYSVKMDKDIYVFPFFVDRALKLNTTSGEITTADAFQPECERAYSATSYMPGFYLTATAIGDKIYAKTGRSNTFIAYDVKTGARREEHIKFPENLGDLFNESLLAAIEEHRDRKQIAACVFYENFYTDIERFIHYNVHQAGSATAAWLRQRQSEASYAIRGREDGAAGKVIYDYCVELWRS